ncbi:MAG: HAD-IA family hydrolase [Sneathiellaceae bacterium]
MAGIKALAFDVGGSVFDWKGAVSAVARRQAGRAGVAVDAEAVAMRWRQAMFATLGRLHRGEIAPCNMDAMLAMALDEVAADFPAMPFPDAGRAELLQAWHEMDAWEEFPAALARMKTKYVTAVVSVLSFAILVDSSKHAGLAWDALISCEFLGAYKPRPEAYIAGARLLGLAPEQVCFVAVHPADLLAAKATGMTTAYVTPKSGEPDMPGLTVPHRPAEHDFNAGSYAELCDLLGC